MLRVELLCNSAGFRILHWDAESTSTYIQTSNFITMKFSAQYYMTLSSLNKFSIAD